VRGRSFSGDGVFGSCSDQPNGPKTTGNGIHGMAPRSSPNAQTGPFAGRFDGDVRISGNFYVGNTLIAYPMLKHASLVLAAGVVTLDRKGEFIVKLPKGTGNLHTNFRYQLTPVGGPAPNLHVAQQIRGDQFKIAGGTGRLSVSWQIAGELKDRRAAVEHAVEKPFDEKAAQAFRRDAKNSARLAGEIRDRERRLTERRSRES
jgi:hypothetical protein